MRTAIATRFGEEFLELGKGSINRQTKTKIARLANGDTDLRISSYGELSSFVIRNNDEDFHDLSIKPAELWT